MSRRLRNEQELLQQLKAEAEEEDDKLKKIQEKIYAPVLWCRLSTGYRIQDVKEKNINDIIEMIKEYYVPNEVLCRNSDIEEEEISMKDYIQHLSWYLRDCTSIMVLDEKNENSLAGVLLLRVVTKADYSRVFSRTAFNHGEARRKCVEISTALNRRIDVFSMFDCEVFLRFYILCLKDEHRHKRLGYHLMRVGQDVARSLHISVCMGVFNSCSMQYLARRLNFKLIQEISYTNWRDKENELIFNDPGAGNYSCALMVARTPETMSSDGEVVKPIPPSELIVIDPPRTRAEKRTLLYKPKTVLEID